MAKVDHTFQPVTHTPDGVLDQSSVKIPPPAPTGPQWKGPLLDEDWHATQASFGGVDFWVQRGSDSEPIKVAEYPRPYTRGASVEVMGQDPRDTPVSALLVKSQVKRLQALRDSMIARTYRDPTLGSYTALLIDVVPSWDAQKLNFYSTELTFKRAGRQSPVKVAVTPQSARDAVRGQNTVAKDAIDATFSSPDIDTGAADGGPADQGDLETTGGDYESAWGNFDDALTIEVEGGPDPSIGKNELAQALTGLSDAADALTASLDEIAAVNTGLLGGTIEALYASRDDFRRVVALAADAVEAVSNEAQSWAKVMITGQTDIPTLIQRELGVTSDSLVAAVMEANAPGFIIDPFNLPIGLEINIPVNLDEFS